MLLLYIAFSHHSFGIAHRQSSARTFLFLGRRSHSDTQSMVIYVNSQTYTHSCNLKDVFSSHIRILIFALTHSYYHSRILTVVFSRSYSHSRILTVVFSLLYSHSCILTVVFSQSYSHSCILTVIFLQIYINPQQFSYRRHIY